MLDDLKKRFKWTAEKVDRWTILDAPNGTLLGDCDDYAITAAWIIAGRSRLRMIWNAFTCKAVMWNVRTTSGQVHMALWVRGKGWTCNIYPEFGPLRHSRRLPFWGPVFLIGLVMK